MAQDSSAAAVDAAACAAVGGDVAAAAATDLAGAAAAAAVAAVGVAAAAATAQNLCVRTRACARVAQSQWRKRATLMQRSCQLVYFSEAFAPFARTRAQVSPLFTFPAQESDRTALR